jgi:F-type H+-transporting ATPase subunit delta
MIVASRYAKSLLDLSLEKKQLDETRKDMKVIATVCEQNRDLVTLLNSPVVKTDKKIEILNAVFGKSISKLSISFLTLLANKRREGFIPQIATSFDELYKKKMNITTAVIKTAIGLDDKLKKRVLEIVKQSAGNSEIELIEKVDPSIIGGFVLSISDRQLDESVKHKLASLKKNLLDSKYISVN